MAVAFYPENHKYVSLDEFEKIDWVSVTSLITDYKEEFFHVLVAQKSIKNKKSKWYGMTVEEVIAIWENESKRSTVLGTWYHNKREQSLYQKGFYNFEGIDYPVIKPLELEGIKIAPKQELTSGIYPEHFVYLKSVGICGQSDRVDVIGNDLYIKDYKTNKKIDREGYVNWEGRSKKLKPPLNHLDDCHYEHYALQLSTYAYIIKKHNPTLNVKSLILEHVAFEEKEKDEYGNPVIVLDENNEPIIKEIEEIKLPYYKREVELMIQNKQ